MHVDRKRDAQKTEDAGLVAESQFKATVTKLDSLGQPSSAESAPRKNESSLNGRRQDTLDRERAADEGMLAPYDDS